LHAELAGVATKLVGLDVDEDGVALARQLGYAAHVVDCTDPDQLGSVDVSPAELVIAGEIIEHLEAPGALLEAMKLLVAPTGLLVVTTPNAASLMNPLAAVGGYEMVHPDHIAIYSWYTLTKLLSLHGWSVRRIRTYHRPASPRTSRSTAHIVADVAGLVQRAAARFWPFVDFGLIAVVSRR
jgi:SAM-dependent methyltransferase